MKKSRFSEQKIVSILKQAEDGMSVQDLCREHGISNATFYNWRSKYGGMSVSMLKRMKELEEENSRLKRMYADERLKAELRKEIIEKKLSSRLPAGSWLRNWLRTTRQVSPRVVRFYPSVRTVIGMIQRTDLRMRR